MGRENAYSRVCKYHRSVEIGSIQTEPVGEQPSANGFRLASELRQLIQSTLDDMELVRIAETIQGADERLLDLRTKRELVGLIHRRARRGELN